MPSFMCARCPQPAVTGSLCAKHSSTKVLEKPRVYGTHNKAFYNNARWKALRELVLTSEPLCLCCKRYGVVRPAVDVDHIMPLSHSPTLSTNLSNLQALCHACHSRKTQHEKKGIIYDYCKGRILDIKKGSVRPID